MPPVFWEIIMHQWTKILIGCYNTPQGIRAYHTQYFRHDISGVQAYERARANLIVSKIHNRDYLLNCLTLGNFKVMPD